MTTHQVSAVIRSTDIDSVETLISEHADVTIYVRKSGEDVWFGGDDTLLTAIENCPVGNMSGQIQHIMYGDASTRSRLGEITNGEITWGHFAPVI